MTRSSVLVMLLVVLYGCSLLPAADGREVVDLSGEGWRLWLDRDAQWQSDRLRLPPVDLAAVEAHAPTGGWAVLAGGPDGAAAVAVPGTVEEYFWGANGRTGGTSGDYRGVSWWWRDLTIPADWAGRRILLRFASANLRAEVYLDEALVGYDTIGNTPFEVDLTAHARPGATHRLAVRITDPYPSRLDGSFDWQDYNAMDWGETKIPTAHGFGGITGDVTLLAVPAVYVNDVYVMNKPSPSAQRPTDVDVQVEVVNRTGAPAVGAMEVRIVPHGRDGEPLFTQRWEGLALPGGVSTHTRSIACPDAELWDLHHGVQYDCRVTLEAGGPAADTVVQTFGFRWFGPDGLGRDAVLRLNGRRIVIRTAISWGFFPVNGIYPTPEMVERQFDALTALGLNTATAHRTIVHPRLLDAADARGILYYCEPGGLLCRQGDEQAHAMAREKLLRMVRRDRSRPSVIHYNMVNEPWFDGPSPYPHHLETMRMAHALDPSRSITWGSGFSWDEIDGSWMAPFDTEIRTRGWNDREHWAASRKADEVYNGPEDFGGIKGDEDQVVYFGEENADSAPPQLGALVADYARWGRTGWDGDDYRAWHEAYRQWLVRYDTAGAFADVDALCRAMGSVQYYHNGRIIENVRMRNVPDGYAINGWECEKLENFSGIVDVARHFKGDPAILAYYNQPLYVAVKSRQRFAEPGGSVTVDFWLVNERDVRGDLELHVACAPADGGEASFTRSFPVQVAGGDTYGQLLVEGVEVPLGPAAGPVVVRAELRRGQEVVATGAEPNLVVDYRSAELPPGGTVLDDSGLLQRFLRERMGYDAPAYDPAAPAPRWVLVGEHEPQAGPLLEALTTAVREQGTVVVLAGSQTDRWAVLLGRARIFRDYRGKMDARSKFAGGNLFALRHSLLEGLPQACGLSWPYMAMISKPDDKSPWKDWRRCGLVMEADSVAIGTYNKNEPRLGAALSLVRYGKGHFVVCTMRTLPYVNEDAPMYLPARKLLVNCLQYGVPFSDWPQP